MARVTDRQLREIASDLQPCSHGRYIKLQTVAHQNGITRQLLNRLLNGRHSKSPDLKKYLDEEAVRTAEKEAEKEEEQQELKEKHEEGVLRSEQKAAELTAKQSETESKSSTKPRKTASKRTKK